MLQIQITFQESKKKKTFLEKFVKRLTALITHHTVL